MTRFWWVRHGPTHVNGFVGWTDAPADLTDVAALKRLDAHLPRDAVVVSSDLQRAVKTADAISQSRERLPNLHGLREMNFGAWEMKNFEQVSAADPTLARAFWENPGDHAPPQGESWHQASSRVKNAVDGLINTYVDRDIIAVAHVGVILSQLQQASQIPATAAMSFVIDNLSVTRLDYLSPNWRVKGVNHKP
jgi:alpha-ribazole phosphatase